MFFFVGVIIVIFKLGQAEADGQFSVSVTTTTATSISLSWSVPSGSMVDSYEVMWTSEECPDDVDEGRDSITGDSSGHTIENLRVGTRYDITVSATGTTYSNHVTGETEEQTPSRAPTSVSLSELTPSSIIVQWVPVDCIHHNGDITGYSVLYRVLDSVTQIVRVLVGSVTTVILSNLIPYKFYDVRVAAVNSAGVGVYSPILFIQVGSVRLQLNDVTIPRHGYVMISDIGSNNDTALTCHTSSGPVNDLIADWIGPSGTAVGTSVSDEHIVPGFRSNTARFSIRLIRYTTSNDPSLNGMTFTPPEGIYHCEIRNNVALKQQAAYVGLYYSGSGGDITISDGVRLTVDSNLNGANPQFTLTCISTGGPATTVTWTRDSDTVTEGSVTELDNRVTAQYTHTLTVTGRLGGLHTCTVSNNKPSIATASFTVQIASAPTRLMVVQEGLTSIRVSWSPPTPLGDTTGYRIYYSGGSSGSEDVSGGSTDNYLLTDLVMGSSYTISIVATSQHFFRDALTYIEVTLIQTPSISVTSITATSISLSWTSTGSEVTSSEVMWQVFRSDGYTKADDNGTSTSGSITSTSYTIEDLESGTIYSITVIVTDAFGSTVSQSTITATVSESENTDSGCPQADNTVGAVIGGSVALVFMITTGVTVIVVLVLRIYRRDGSIGTQKKGAANGRNTLASTVDTHDLSQIPEEAICDEPGTIHTSRNKAYQVVKPTGTDLGHVTIPTTRNKAYRVVKYTGHEVVATKPSFRILPSTSHSSCK